MSKNIEQAKKAVDSGYWHLYRYNPLLAEENKNPFTLDSKEPTEDFVTFCAVKHAILRWNKSSAGSQRAVCQGGKRSQERYAGYKKLAD